MDDNNTAGIGDNVLKGDVIRNYVEREERINSQIQALRDERKDLRKDIKNAGYSPKMIAELVRIRADESGYREWIGLLGSYAASIGLQLELDMEADR